MLSIPSCVYASAQAVYRHGKTVPGLCKFIVQYHHQAAGMLITTQLSPRLYAGCAPSFPLGNSSINRGVSEFIPTIHIPNNKSYMDTLDINTGKLWIGSYTT